MLAPGASGADTVAQPRLVLQITVDALRGDLPGRNAHLASLATGTVPAAHGMVGNVWFDREDGRLIYNIEDPDHRLLTAGADVDDSTEIDPTQRAAEADGRSPSATLASTHGSPWRYDTFVPIMFAGPGIEPRRVSRPVTPYDVAPTLAELLGVKAPSSAIGNPLKEVAGE
jgi:predicted AlkP superfamily pyrophosphatase or phosphodiesterase